MNEREMNWHRVGPCTFVVLNATASIRRAGKHVTQQWNKTCRLIDYLVLFFYRGFRGEKMRHVYVLEI